MVALASVEDLEVLMGRTFAEGSELDQAEMVLEAVSAWSRAVAGQLWSDESDAPSDVKHVVLAASRRSLRNPDGVVSESMGPFSKTYDRPPVNFFTPGELAILKRWRPRSSSGGLMTIGFTRGEKANPRTVGHLFIDGEPFPCLWPGDPDFVEEYDVLD